MKPDDCPDVTNPLASAPSASSSEMVGPPCIFLVITCLGAIGAITGGPEWTSFRVFCVGVLNAGIGYYTGWYGFQRRPNDRR